MAYFSKLIIPVFFIIVFFLYKYLVLKTQNDQK
jgi:hypothetical protein